MGEQLIGLLECPYRSGWIEFAYSAGDRVETLKQSIEAKWGGLDNDRELRHFAKSWAVFCKQQDGTYRALRNKDKIPTFPPAQSTKEVLTEPSFDPSYRRGGIFGRSGVLDFLTVNRYWKLKGDWIPVDPKENYTMKFDFVRDYELPPQRQHAITLLALVAIAGG